MLAEVEIAFQVFLDILGELHKRLEKFVASQFGMPFSDMHDSLKACQHIFNKSSAVLFARRLRSGMPRQITESSLRYMFKPAQLNASRYPFEPGLGVLGFLKFGGFRELGRRPF